MLLFYAVLFINAGPWQFLQPFYLGLSIDEFRMELMDLFLKYFDMNTWILFLFLQNLIKFFLMIQLKLANLLLLLLNFKSQLHDKPLHIHNLILQHQILMYQLLDIRLGKLRIVFPDQPFTLFLHRRSQKFVQHVLLEVLCIVELGCVDCVY